MGLRLMILNVKNAMKRLSTSAAWKKWRLYLTPTLKLENTVEIAKRCNVEITLDNTFNSRRKVNTC